MHTGLGPTECPSRRNVLKSGLALTASAALGASGCASRGARASGSGKTRRLVYAYEQPPESAQGITAEIFKGKLEELSSGRLTVELYPSAQLGSEPATLQQVRMGGIDIINSATANAAVLAPQAGVFSLHYLFRGNDHLARVVSNERVNKVFREMISHTVDGASALTLYTMGGARNIYSKETEVRSLDDIVGRKVRVQATPTEDMFFRAYGAQTVHMAFTELYTSLQTGVVDMAENGINVYESNLHHEIAPIYSYTQHEANHMLLWISDNAWRGLSAREQEWVEGAAKEVRRTQPAKAFELDRKVRRRLQNQGIRLVDEVDRESFRRVAEPMQDRVARDLGPHAVKLVGLVRDLS